MPNRLNNCRKSGSGGIPTEADLQDFLRAHKSYEVPPAIAVAKVLDQATAMKIASVNDVLAKLTGS